MRFTTRLPGLTLAGLLTSAAISAQTPPATAPGTVPASSAPLLTTGTKLPPGLTPQPVQMSGMPLQVGDLAPGTVVVRVIRRTFAENIARQEVLLVIDKTGRVMTVATSADGRAQFTGLAVGDVVSAQTKVGDEQLESQRFELPPRGGVRLVLVAGIGAGVPEGTSAGSGSPAVPAVSGTTAAPSTAPVAARGAPVPSGRVTTGTVVWVMLGVFVFVGLIVLTPRDTLKGALAWIAARRVSAKSDRLSASTLAAVEAAQPEHDPAATMQTDSSPQATAHRRKAAFEELVRLERDHAAGDVGAGRYATAREALITELVALDTALGDMRADVRAKVG